MPVTLVQICTEIVLWRLVKRTSDCQAEAKESPNSVGSGFLKHDSGSNLLCDPFGWICLGASVPSLLILLAASCSSAFVEGRPGLFLK